MSVTPNPFIEQARQEHHGNPFMDLAPAAPPAVVPDPPKGVTRKLRPNGELYSSDPSERAKQLVEDGKLGAPFAHLGGRPRNTNKRAAEVVAEFASDQADSIKAVFEDGIDSSQPIGIRLQAAREILKVEADVTELEMKKREQEFSNMNKGKLVEEITKMVGELQQAGALANSARDMANEDVVDAVVVEDVSDSYAA